MRRLYTLLLALLLGVLAYVYSTTTYQPVALAHAFVIGSDPVDGTTINSVPNIVRIFFNAPISSISVAHIYVTQNGNFVEVKTIRSIVSSSNPRELDTFISEASGQPHGSYEIKWTAVANDDGQTTHGLIGFNVGFSSVGLAGETTLGPSSSNTLDVRDLTLTGILAIAWDWFVLAALTLWIGILVIERLIVAKLVYVKELLDRTRKQTLALQWLCLTALLVGELVSLLLRATRFTQLLNNGGLDFRALLQLLTASNYGYYWIARVILILVALGLLRWTSRPQEHVGTPEPVQRAVWTPVREYVTGPLRQYTTQSHAATSTVNITKDLSERVENRRTIVQPPARTYTAVWLLLASLIVLTYALTGNAALIAQPHITSIVFEWLRLVAQGIWFGAFAYLGYILLPLLSVVELDHHAGMLVAFLRRLTPYIVGAMAIVVVSDLFTTEMTISDAQLLVSDPYGRTLLVRLIITAVMLLLSLFVLFAFYPKLTRQVALLPVVNAELPARRARQSALEQTERGLKQGTGIVSLIGAGILLCTALMSFYAPPIVFPNITYANPATSQSNTTVNQQTKPVGDLSVTVQVLPGQVNAANKVIISINDSSGKTITNAKVVLSINMVVMDMGTDHATINGGHPTYITTFQHSAAFSMGGLWNLNLSIQQPGKAAVRGTFEITIAE